MNIKLIPSPHTWTPVEVDGVTYRVGIGSGKSGARIVATGTMPSVGLSPDATMAQAIAWWTDGFEAPPASTEAGRIVAAMLEKGFAERV